MTAKNLSVDAHKAFLDAAMVCNRLSREAAERRDAALSRGEFNRAKSESVAVSACLDCGEAILALLEGQ